MWEQLERDYRNGNVIRDPVDQATYRAESFWRRIRFTEYRKVESRWDWALHISKIKEDAFRN